MSDHSSISKASSIGEQEPTMSITLTNSMRLALIALVKADVAACIKLGSAAQAASHQRNADLLQALHTPSGSIHDISAITSKALKVIRK